jgi:two-component system nitrogen regulation response regulator GlnG
MKSNGKILIIDDEESIRWVMKKGLEKKHFIVDTATNGEQALEKIRQENYLLVFSDIFLDGMSGLELLKLLQTEAPYLKVVMMTAQDSMNNTIEAMRTGAFDYLSKPFDFDEVYSLVERAIAAQVSPSPESTSGELEPGDPLVDAIIGKSREMQDVFKIIGKSAGSDLPVLITGESGTGKEMVARALHYYSQRNDQAFICINCAAIARELLESELFGHERGAFTGAVDSKQGKFELANGGTLFLDEIGDMEHSLQAKILRVLQNNEFYRVGGKEPLKVDVRIVAATNQNLESMMLEKKFRDDLYHRLNVIAIQLPPLRDRPEDIPLLANHFVRKYSKKLSRGHVYLTPEVEQLLRNHPWQGNIRELENVIKRAIVLALHGPILPEHLPPQFQIENGPASKNAERWEKKLNRLILDYLETQDWEQEEDLHDRLIQAMEKQMFEIILQKNSGKQVPTAKVLGINRNTLKRKIDAMNIQVKKIKDKLRTE